MYFGSRFTGVAKNTNSDRTPVGVGVNLTTRKIGKIAIFTIHDFSAARELIIA
jgi:hypothetical protein